MKSDSNKNAPCLSMDEDLQQFVEESLDDMGPSEFQNVPLPRPKTPTCSDPPHRQQKGAKKVDKRLQEELRATTISKPYTRMLGARKLLPAFKMKKTILKTIENNQVVIISGEMGCGKTTQVPQLILDDAISKGNGSRCRIICTQPRRISAISIAQRVAEERAEWLGQSVGFQIRLESELPRHEGSVLFCTEGIVLKKLRSDPCLNEISHLILDEVHERSLLLDLLMCICRDILPKRPGLKLILMSATLNAKQFSQYFGKAPILHIPGQRFPVTEYYLEDVLEMMNADTSIALTKPAKPKQQRKGKRKGLTKPSPEFEKDIVPEIMKLSAAKLYSQRTINQLLQPTSEQISRQFVCDLIIHIHTKNPPGAVLVFLSGWQEISDLNDLIESYQRTQRQKGPWEELAVFSLHSQMATWKQSRCFHSQPEGIRKVVLATNIAETSITIDDIVYVINCGQVKVAKFEVKVKAISLLPEWVTIANVRQRKGRCGRTQAGICYHLLTKARENLLEKFPVPAIQCSQLEETILMIKLLNLGMCKPFLAKALAPPDDEFIDVALKFLQSISALDPYENLTSFGYHLAQLPVNPLLGKMLILSTIFSCVDPVLTIAASLDFNDVFDIRRSGHRSGIPNTEDRGDMVVSDQQSDHIHVANVFRGWQRSLIHNTEKIFVKDNLLCASTLRYIEFLREFYMKCLYQKNFTSTSDPMDDTVNLYSENFDLVRAVIAAGLCPNIARIVTQNRGVQAESQGMTMAVVSRSVNAKIKSFDGIWFTYYKRIRTSRDLLQETTMVQNFPIVLFGGALSYDTAHQLLVVGDVKFKCSMSIYDTIKRLRERVDSWLTYKMSLPGRTTSFTMNEQEKKIMIIIREMLEEEAYSSQTI